MILIIVFLGASLSPWSQNVGQSLVSPQAQQWEQHFLWEWSGYFLWSFFYWSLIDDLCSVVERLAVFSCCLRVELSFDMKAELPRDESLWNPFIAEETDLKAWVPFNWPNIANINQQRSLSDLRRWVTQMEIRLKNSFDRVLTEIVVLRRDLLNHFIGIITTMWIHYCWENIAQDVGKR